MKDEIKAQLSKLIEKPLWGVGRSADLEWFQFGDKHTVPAYGGGAKQVGDYALHIQCAWRIIETGSVVVASQDMYVPADDPVEIPYDFEWDVVGANLCDLRVAELFSRHVPDLPIVTEVRCDDLGGFQVNLSRGITVDVFPDSSRPVEYWRLFQPAEESPHFVVTGAGIER